LFIFAENACLDFQYLDTIIEEKRKYECAVKENRFLVVKFETVDEYLDLLECIAMCFSKFRATLPAEIVSQYCPLFYLAAAVSDFYLPIDQMVEHKIQSTGSALLIELQPVPKKLKSLTSIWCPFAFVVSFKLETDNSILFSKAASAIVNYGVDMVVANLLQVRGNSC
jgi:phosphopantothenate-cysteine ligase